MKQSSKILATIILFFLLGEVSAQVNTYDLNTYKYRYQMYRGLNFYGNFDQRGYVNNNIQENRSNDTTISNLNQNLNNTLDIRANYYSLVNTEALQKNVSSYANIVGSFNNGSNENIAGSNQYRVPTISTNVGYTESTRKYKSSNVFGYTEKTGNLNIRQERQNFKIDGANEVTQSGWFNSSANISLKKGAGRGRIDHVTDVVSALFLVEDLHEKGLGSADNNQIEKLAKGITYINNQRYLDFRFAWIDQISMLDSILKEAGISSESELTYFTVLTDNWQNARRLTRITGNRFTAYYGLDLDYYNDRQRSTYWDLNQPISTFSASRTLYAQPQLGIDYVSAKQLDQHRQFSWGGSLSASFIGYVYQSKNAMELTKNIPKAKYEEDLIFGNNAIKLELYSFVEWIYQPNSRSYFSLNLSPQASLTNSAEGIDFSGTHITSINPSLNTSLNYFRFVNRHINFNINLRSQSTFYEQNNIIKSDVLNVYKQLSHNHTLAFGINYLLF
ncbi:MAG: hypothetical protein ACI8ZN_000881 [Bacteroidia bacterium]|jgi:hypothetical protein